MSGGRKKNSSTGKSEGIVRTNWGEVKKKTAGTMGI